MSATHVRLMLALTAIKLRCRGPLYGIQVDISKLCDDALQGLNMDRSPEDGTLRAERFDPVRVDGVAGFEAEIRHRSPNSDASEPPEPDPKEPVIIV